jgi:HAD superfamily hydrolase (TIGR01509 family)
VAIAQLVWDMDGTLLDSTVAVPAAFAAAVARLGGPAVTPEQVVASYARGTPETILAHLTGRDIAAAEAEAYYRELADARVAPYPGVREALSELRTLRHAVAVFTGASRRAAQMLLRAAGLTVDVLVGGDEVARPKPAGDGLLLAAARLGAAPGQLAYIGDSPLDLRAARAAGCHGAAAAWGHQYQRAEPADYTLAAPGDVLVLLGAVGCG